MDNENQQKPEIIITDADLEAADLKIKTGNDFFSNPNPKPLRPTALVDVTCTKSKRKFAAYFEQQKPNSWVLTEYIDDTVIGSPQYGRAATIQNDLVQGNVDWSVSGTKLFCPYCHAPSLVKCGECHAMSCHPDGQQGSQFHCPLCGHIGTLNGYIQSLDGSSGKKR